jgi:hypothetical protein
LLFYAVPSHSQQRVACLYYLQESEFQCAGSPCTETGQHYWETKCMYGGGYACSWDSGTGSCCNSVYNTDTLYDPSRYGQVCDNDMPPPDTRSKTPKHPYKLENPEFAQLFVYNRCRGTYDAIEVVRVNPTADVYWRP